MRALDANSIQTTFTLGSAQHSILIEISDEAYKQNTVYRPWGDIVDGHKETKYKPPVSNEDASAGDIPRSVR
jgi:hypothetical protein